jgi:SEC-C motif
MAEREIRLETAAFLDSPQAKGLAVRREDARTIVDRFLGCAYDEVGVAPRLLDGEAVHAIVGHLLPARFGRKDPLGPYVIEVLRSYLAFLHENAVVAESFEQKRALEATADEFEETVRTGSSTHHAPAPKGKPFVHRVDRVGRNDPCPCGSGKKFKQCCSRIGG